MIRGLEAKFNALSLLKNPLSSSTTAYEINQLQALEVLIPMNDFYLKRIREMVWFGVMPWEKSVKVICVGLKDDPCRSFASINQALVRNLSNRNV